MFSQPSQSVWCHRPQGEDLELRPVFLGEYRDSGAPFVSAEEERTRI
jgi:hypothetical protein